MGARGGHRGALRDLKAKLKDPFRRLKKTKNNENPGLQRRAYGVGSDGLMAFLGHGRRLKQTGLQTRVKMPKYRSALCEKPESVLTAPFLCKPTGITKGCQLGKIFSHVQATP